MTKIAKFSMVGSAVALLLASLIAMAGCSNDTNAATNSDNAAPANNSAASDNAANQMGDGSGLAEGTVLKVSNGWVAYSNGDMLVLLDSSADAQYQWTSDVSGDSVLKDTDADLPSSTYYDQNANDVIGSAGMHVFGFMADQQNNGESTITFKLANATDSADVNTTIVVKATVESGAFSAVSVQQ